MGLSGFGCLGFVGMAARRAVQNQAGAGLQAMQFAAVASRPSAIPAELIGSDVKLKVPVARAPMPVDWQFLQDRRPSLYSYGLTPLKAWNYAAVRGYYMRNISQLVATANNKRAFLVDTLALVISNFLSRYYPTKYFSLVASENLIMIKYSSIEWNWNMGHYGF